LPQRSTSLDSAAESIGTALGHLAARLDDLKKQRKNIVGELNAIVARGQAMLRELGHGDAPAARRNKGGRPKGYLISDATRAKLRAAWKRRQEGGQVKKRTMSEEARAKIAAAQRARWAAVRRQG
jgi:hypothetical protein